ncbi:MAG: ATP-binding cassette domain-containing protein [Opitutae bacterium]
MKIELRNIIPAPLPHSVVSGSELWGKDYTFNQGESILAYAPSGKGKSTLLHIIYGLRKDFTGELVLGEQLSPQSSMGAWQDARSHKLSILFQDMRLFPHLSTRQNLALLPVLSSVIPPVEEMCERLGVLALLEQRVSTLSHGQRQRIALIRSLCKPFRWLLLDEPFSHLDPANTELAVQLIEEIRMLNHAGLILTSLQEESPLQCMHRLQL